MPPNENGVFSSTSATNYTSDYLTEAMTTDDDGNGHRSRRKYKMNGESFDEEDTEIMNGESEKCEILDISKVSKVLIALFLPHVVLLICSYSLGYSRFSIYDYDTNEEIAHNRVFHFDDSLRQFLDEGEYLVAVLEIFGIYFVPFLRICMLCYVSYVFVTYLGNTSINRVASNSIDSSLEDKAIDLEGEYNAYKIAPWSNANYFALRSKESRLKLAQVMLNVCILTSRMQIGNFFCYMFVDWATSASYQFPDDNGDIQHLKGAGLPQEAFWCFHSVFYLTVFTTIILSWTLSRWLIVYKREQQTVQDHYSRITGNLQTEIVLTDETDDIDTSTNENMTDLLLPASTREDLSENNSDFYTRILSILRKDRTLYILILVNFASWIYIFVAKGKIFKVRSYDGYAYPYVDEPVRNIGFWELNSEFHDLMHSNSKLERGIHEFIYVFFFFIIPTVRFIMILILEIVMLPYFNKNCVNTRDNKERSISRSSERSNDKKQWYRNLYLSQKYLYLFSGDFVFSFNSVLLISLLKRVAAVKLNAELEEETLLLMRGVWQWGDYLAVAWGLTGNALYAVMESRRDYVIYQ